MKLSVYRISLDVHDAHSGECLDMKQKDTARRIAITLTDGGFPYQIGEECYAVFAATKADGKKLRHHCSIEKNTILYEVRPQTTSAVGLMECEIKLYGSGDKLLMSPGFSILVSEDAVTDDDELESEDEVDDLTKLISEATTVITEGKQLMQDMTDEAEGLAAQVSEAKSAATRANAAATRANLSNENAAKHASAASNSADVAITYAGNAETAAQSADSAAERAAASATTAAAEAARAEAGASSANSWAKTANTSAMQANAAATTANTKASAAASSAERAEAAAKRAEEAADNAGNGSDSGQNPTDKLVLKSPDGTVWSITVSDSGVINATKQTSGGDSGETEDAPTTLETYTIFVPENVSDEWNTGGTGSTEQAKTLNVSASEFLELFYDGFVSAPPSGMTVSKRSIGKDETGQYDMWEYDFCPTNYSRTILLSSGMHTYELSASFGLANFIGHLYTDSGNDAFAYIRNNVRVKIVPIVNPWGFSQSPKTYGNANGVNPNRNFDLDGAWESFPVYTPDENEWNVKGIAPFSEAEAQNLAKWAMDNWNAEFWIDCHTGLGYHNYDNWIYYSSDSAILDRITAALEKLEAWFEETYGSVSRTNRTIDNEGSIRLHWAERLAGIPGITLEQAPGNTIFGTSSNNDSGDISNYSTCISTYVQEFLMEKYRSNTVVEVTGVSASNVTLAADDASVTAEATVSPNDTTQNKFKWESSDTSVCDVYGCTNKAVVVRKGPGTATITVRNHEDSAISTSFTVTVEENSAPMEIPAGIRKMDLAFYAPAAATNRVLTDLVAVPAGKLVISNDNGYYLKVFTYDEDKQAIVSTDFGELTSVSASGTVEAGYVRILLKKPDNSDFTEEEMLAIAGTINDSGFTVVNTDETIPTSMALGAGIRGIDVTSGAVIENNARILTDGLKCVIGSGSLTVTSVDGYYIKGFVYGEDGTFNNKTFGNLTGNNINLPSLGNGGGFVYVRIVIKKPDGSDFTEEEMLEATLTINGITCTFVETSE